MNLYVYVGNNPVNMIDPSGHIGCQGLKPNEVIVCGRRSSPGFSGGTRGSSSLPPATRINENLAPICARVSRNGNNILIETPVEFYYGDPPLWIPDSTTPVAGADGDYYLGLMNNGRWNGPIGRYTLDTRMTRGPGGYPVFIGNPGLAGGGEAAGPSHMYLGRPIHPVTDSIYVDHGLGHAFGNPHDPAGIGPGVANVPGNLMFDNPFNARPRDPLESHVKSLIELCGLGGE